MNSLNSNDSYTVLVLDAEQRSALSVTRSVGSMDGINVITADSYKMALAGTSRRSSHYLECPSSQDSPTQFIEWLALVIEKHSISLLLPVTEITSQLILMYKDKLPDVRLPFLSYEKLIQISDKSNLVQIANTLDVTVPDTQYFKSVDELVASKLIYPCVLKPSRSQYYEDNRWISTTVRVLDSSDDLDQALQTDTYLKNHDFMIQEFIPGFGAGLFCYYNNGEPKVFFAHNRLREKPPSGGVSVLSESVAVPDSLKQAALKLLGHVKWHGVAMVEFRISPDSTAYLMEVNTRFWGSLQLAIDSGVDFPQWVCATELGLPLPVQKPYQVGQRLRWLLGDFDSLYLYFRSDKYSVVQKAIRFVQFCVGTPFKTKHEINRLGDFKPAVYEFKKYLKELIN